MSELKADLELTRGAFRLEVALRIPERGVTALFGPSGSGKTLILRCLAGLERAERAEVVVSGEVWQDAKSKFVPPHLRRVGYVIQEALLFPHLSVEQNLSFGFRRAQKRKQLIALDAAIEQLGLVPLLGRFPATLSGGERQRVAIARALVVSPSLLLMDEPLAALDAAAKDAILPHLERLHRTLEIPIVYVSHSIDEVARLADGVVWLDAGRIRATGTAASLLGRLDFGQVLGEQALSFIEASVTKHDDSYELTELDSAWGPLWTHRLAARPAERVRLRVHARDVSLSLNENTKTSVLNSLAASVSCADRSGGEMLVRLSRPGGDEVLLARITSKSYDELGLREGTRVWARIKAVSVR